MNIPNNQCQYPGHEHVLEDTSSGGGSVIYLDAANGIMDQIRVCDEHYKMHILKFYPDSSIAAWYRKQDGKRIVQGKLI